MLETTGLNQEVMEENPYLKYVIENGSFMGGKEREMVRANLNELWAENPAGLGKIMLQLGLTIGENEELEFLAENPDFVDGILFLGFEVGNMGHLEMFQRQIGDIVAGQLELDRQKLPIDDVMRIAYLGSHLRQPQSILAGDGEDPFKQFIERMDI